MRGPLVFTSAVVVLCAVAAFARQDVAPAPAPSQDAADPTPHPERLVGTWKYDDGASVDAVTGKPERAGTTRPTPGALPTGGSDTSSTPISGTGVTSCFGCQGTSSGDPNVGAVILGLNNLAANAPSGGTPMSSPTASERAQAEARDLLRDLTEIPESLTIAATPAVLDLTDDLGRELKYPLDGKKRAYHISASSYDAAAHWSGPAVVIEISGAHEFKMSEAFLGAADGRHLFEIVRIGSAPKTGAVPPPTRGTGPTTTMRPGTAGPGRAGSPASAMPATSTTGTGPSTPDSPHPAGVNRVFDRTGTPPVAPPSALPSTY